jgi:hypothetical protein
MNDIEFSNLVYNDSYNVYVYGNNDFDAVVCGDFIRLYFGFKKLPKKIKTMKITKSQAGFIKLKKVKTLSPIKGDNIFWEPISGKRLFKKYFKEDSSTYIEEALIELFNSKEKEIYVDVYVEDWTF